MRVRQALWAGALALGLGPAGAEVLDLSPDEVLLTAQAAYAAGNYAVANHLAHALLLVDPEDPFVQLLIAGSAPKLGRAEEGLKAGRLAWKFAKAEGASDALRYEIARHTAKAAMEDDRLVLAQLWLRRSLDVAPDAQARARSGEDLAFVRDQNPWRYSFALEAGPSDNLNGGAEDGVFQIGDLILGSLSNGSEALSGTRAHLRVSAQRLLPASATAQNVLSLTAETLRHHIDSASQAKAGSVRSRDLDQERLSLGLRRDQNVKGHALSYGVELGQNWAGGEVLGPSLTLLGQAQAYRGESGAVWLALSAQRNWRASAPKTIDQYSATLIGQRQWAGLGQFSLALTYETMRSQSVNATYDAAQISASYAPEMSLGASKLRVEASAGLRDYEAFSLGFAHVTGGRQDKSFGLSLDISFEDWDVMGFAPVLTLSHGETRSNISRYDTSTSGISLGVASVF